MTDKNPHIISSGSSLLDALDSLNRLSGGVMTLMVVDDEGRMKGTLTDGDIRRALLRGISTSAQVTEVMHRDFKSLKGDNDDTQRLRSFRMNGIKLIPQLDEDGRIARLFDLTSTKSILPIRAILMAGGRGERLRPMTLTTPKPLLKIGGKSIIDYNIEALASCGIEDIFVTTNYLAEQLEEHFSRPVGGVEVKCVREPSALGTIGSTALVPRGRGDCTLVMNSDLLTNISFEDMYLHHVDNHADITIASISYMVSIPFAIMTTDGINVNGLQEKPSYTYQANAGIYIIANDLISAIAPGTRIDAPELIEQAIAQGRTVTYFPINGTWIDIGSPADFRQAEQLMAHINDFTR